MIPIEQGAMFLAELDPIRGHEQGGFRPVLVLQNNKLNRDLNTLIVAPLTTNMKFKGLFTTTFIQKSTGMLSQDSVVLLYQLRTIDKSRLKKYLGKINLQQFWEVRQQLMFVF